MTALAIGPAMCLVLGLFHSVASANDRSRPPNIIFILADDLGYGDLGCYGQRWIDTPSIDRMAAHGLRCTQCYAGSTVCAPSRSVLMTGLHTGHTRVRRNGLVPLRPEDVTVAEALESAGYKTAIIGKWGLGEPESTGIPNRQGFAHWFGYLNQQHAHNYYPDILWRNEAKVRIEGNVVALGVASKKTTYSHDLFIEDAMRYLSEHQNDRFFLYLALTIPHANNEAGRLTGNGMEVPDLGIYADRDWPEPEKGRAAMITRMDRDIGRILEKLQELGISEETVVFFSSDNGPHSEGSSNTEFFDSNGLLRGEKRDLYEGGIRVPLIVHWPGIVRPGTVSDEACGFWDFLPTAANLAGAEGPPNLDGQSIRPLFRSLPLGRVPRFYWEFHERGFQQACRLGNWKAIRQHGPKEAWELYDLENDPAETRNVADEQPTVIAQARAFLESERTPSEDWPIRPKK